MYGPAVRCKKIRRAGGKRSCINVSGLWLEAVLRAIMDISARAISLAERPLGAIWVTKIATLGEAIAGPDRGYHRAGDKRSDAGDTHQALAPGIAAG